MLTSSPVAMPHAISKLLTLSGSPEVREGFDITSRHCAMALAGDRGLPVVPTVPISS